MRNDLSKMAIPDWNLVSEAIKAGRTDEALEMLEFTRTESQTNNDHFVSFVEMVVTHLAWFGEEEVAKIFRRRYEPRMRQFLSATSGVEEELRKSLEPQRRHHANFTITEETDKYVVRYNPCGSGGRLRRTTQVGVTKRAYPWSWGMSGVPYYCCHCCVHWEIIPTELRGYPVRITSMGDRPEDP